MRVAITSGAFGYQIKSIFRDTFNLETDILYKEIPKEYDLYVFSGGGDISPTIYGEKNITSYGVNINKDKFELQLLTFALMNSKKIFGICRGHQLINAALGGKLYQDLSEIAGEYHSSNHKLNKINSGIVPSSFDIVNSLHHQAVKTPGDNLIVTSIYNGCIESTENEQIITTQFHPEIMEDNFMFFSRLVDWVKNPIENKYYRDR